MIYSAGLASVPGCSRVASLCVMAGRLLSPLLSPYRRFSVGVSGVRGWRNETPTGSKTEVFVYSPESNIAWPDPLLGVFNRADPKFGLPGNIGAVGVGDTGRVGGGARQQPDVLTVATTTKSTLFS